MTRISKFRDPITGALPPLAGGDRTYVPDNFSLPYQGAPEIGLTTMTVDWLAQSPARVSRVIADLTLQRFYVDRIFSPGANPTGGAVVFDMPLTNDLYASRDVARVEPGESFPIVTFERTQAQTAQVEKFGGKFPITDEAIRRNQGGRVNQALQQLANTIRRKTQQRAIAELRAAITTYDRTAVASSWADQAGEVYGTRAPAAGIVGDLTSIELANEQLELGVEYNMAIMNPIEWRNLRLAAGGTNEDARSILADSGITQTWVTNRKAAGSVYWLAAGQVGELGYEVPLTTETWRDPQGKQQTWFQSYILPIMYVTDPLNILETTGHGA